MRRTRASVSADPPEPHVVDALLDDACLDRGQCEAAGIGPDQYDWLGWLEWDPRYCTSPQAKDALLVRLRSVWRRHRVALLQEWERRGGTGPCWAARAFEGEGGTLEGRPHKVRQGIGGKS